MLDPQVEENPLVVDETGVLTPIRVRKSSLIRDGGGGGVPHFFTAKTNFTPHHINTIFPLQGMVLLTAVNVVVVTLLWYFDI